MLHEILKQKLGSDFLGLFILHIKILVITVSRLHSFLPSFGMSHFGVILYAKGEVQADQ